MNCTTKTTNKVPRFGEKAIETAEKKLAAFHRFKDSNDFEPCGAWPYIVARCRELARAGRSISARRLLEEVRGMDFFDADGTPTSVNNDLEAPMARYLLRLHPEWKPYIELRPSALDEIM